MGMVHTDGVDCNKCLTNKWCMLYAGLMCNGVACVCVQSNICSRLEHHTYGPIRENSVQCFYH